MDRKTVSIPIEEDARVSGVLTVPDDFPREGGTGAILAHGAANDMDNPLLVAAAEGLAEAGYPALRFNFLYRERGKKSVDSQAVLERTWGRVFAYFVSESGYRPDRVIGVGKSLGARIASQLAAEGRLDVDRLVFLGYPLHPPGKKDQLRDAHLRKIRVPMLFFAGTRDPFADMALLKRVVEGLPAPWTLETVEGGDHSFELPESAGVAREAVHRDIVGRLLRWLKKDPEAGGVSSGTPPT